MVDDSSNTRVLCLHPALAPYRIDFFNRLGSNFRFKLVFLRRNLIDQKFDQERLKAKLEVDYSYLKSGFSFMKRVIPLSIWKEIKDFNPRVLVTSEFSFVSLISSFYVKARRDQVKHIVWTDDSCHTNHDDSFLRKAARKFILNNCSGIIFVSNEARDLYKKCYGWKGKSAVSPILHSENSFREALNNSTSEAKRLIAKHSLEGKKVLLYVGRLAKEKRIDRVINAYRNLTETFPDSILAIVGSGPEQAVLKDMAEGFGLEDNILFVGRCEGNQLGGWFRIGSVFVLASEYEPFGAVVNEALLAGLPVVCSHRAGSRVLISHGYNGAVIDAQNEQLLSSSLRSLLLTAKPVDKCTLVDLRPSLMCSSFKDSVDSCVRLISSLLM